MRRRYLFLFLIGSGTAIFDQITKHHIQKNFMLHESVSVIDGFFSLTYILNPGAAFGIFSDQSETFRAIFFMTVSVIALILLAFFFRQTPSEDTFSLIAISLLFGGAIGNMIDRMRMGEVVDFLDFYIGQYHWPAFNVADSAITIGVSLLMLQLFLQKEEVTEKNVISR